MIRDQCVVYAKHSTDLLLQQPYVSLVLIGELSIVLRVFIAIYLIVCECFVNNLVQKVANICTAYIEARFIYT